MTSRDTHDILAYEAEQKSHNIQPSTLVMALVESEPGLFNNENLVPVIPTTLDPKALFMLGRMLEAAKFHAEYQIAFWKELAS